jgi:hypothetical protein
VADLLLGREDDAVGAKVALRLMGAVHRRVLEGELPELAPYYFGEDGDAWPAFKRAIAGDAEAIGQLLDRPVQTNDVGRCAALLPGFMTVVREVGMPLRLLEIGTSAGLNLHWDRYRYETTGFSWGDLDSPVRLRFQVEGEPPRPADVTIAERRGCDRSPIDPTSEEGRLTVLSYVWPDQVHRVARARVALDFAREVPVQIESAGAVEWIGPQLAERHEGVATVIFHSIVMGYLEEDERREFEAKVMEAGHRADTAAPVAWLRMESAGDRAEVRLTLWPDGADRLIARASYHGDLVDLRPGG